MSWRTKQWISITLLITFLLVLYMLAFRQTQAMEYHLNETVVIDSDTTTIVGYSTWRGEYTLSNGTTISKEFLNK